MIIFSKAKATENALEALPLVARSFALRHFAPLSLVELLYLLTTIPIAKLSKSKWLTKSSNARVLKLAGFTVEELQILQEALAGYCGTFLFPSSFPFSKLFANVKASSEKNNDEATSNFSTSQQDKNNAMPSLVMRHVHADVKINIFNEESSASEQAMYISPVLLPSVHALLATLSVGKGVAEGNSSKLTQAMLKSSKAEKNSSLYAANAVVNLSELPSILPELIVQHNALIVLANENNYSEIKPGLWVHQSAKVHETVAVFQTSKTPTFTVLGEGVEVQPFVTLKGSNYVGAGSVVKTGAVLHNCSLANSVRIAGEVSNTSVDDFSNKAHDGFLGNSIIGSFVNIGASSVFSNLKSTYGKIALTACERVVEKNKRYYKNIPIPTQQTFFGSIVGDYAKLGIGTRVATGKIIGLGAMVGGEVNVAKPSFYFRPPKRGSFEKEILLLDSFLETQKRMTMRRGLEMEEMEVQFLTELYKKFCS